MKKAIKRVGREARDTLRWLATGRTFSRKGEGALLRWHAGPDAERDNERAGRPHP